MDSDEEFNSPQSSGDEGMADFDSDVSDQDGGIFSRTPVQEHRQLTTMSRL